MSNYIVRIEKELKALDKKISKLNSFINEEDGKYQKLIELDRQLLIIQLNAMYAYGQTLELRLKLAYAYD